MLHIYENSSLFNVPKNLFLESKYYCSYSYLSRFVDDDGYIGPSGCNAISTNKKSSVLKSFSESLERRAIMLGGKVHTSIKENKYVKVWDIINNKEDLLEYQYTRYRNSHPHNIDTTGSASHIDSTLAINNALKELLEKNSLFLFWYGKDGYKLNTNNLEDNPYYKRLKKNGFDIQIFTNDYFSPLLCVFTIITKNNLIYSTGVGSGFYWEEVINRSLAEAYLLGWQNIVLNNIKSFNQIKHIECINYMEQNFEEKPNSFITPQYKSGMDNESELLLKSIPGWVKKVFVIHLNKSMYNKLKCVKVFSPDLNNHIPIKSRIDLKQPINLHTININKNHLKKIPDCVFI